MRLTPRHRQIIDDAKRAPCLATLARWHGVKKPAMSRQLKRLGVKAPTPAKPSAEGPKPTRHIKLVQLSAVQGLV